MVVTHASELSTRRDALNDNHDAFTVVISNEDSILEGEDVIDANVEGIAIVNLSVSARDKVLIKNASLKIYHKKRYGLIGPNGMGKSTLLKLLACRKIPVPNNIDVVLVEQEIVGDDRTALEAVVSANEEEAIILRKEVSSLQVATTTSAGVNGDAQDTAETRASRILTGLGFTKDMQGRPTKSFNGGWRMRISLARGLFIEPSLLLLDEPTNYLDFRALLWLEAYLCRWKKTLVVVSHDIDFLETVCTHIILLHDFELCTYRISEDGMKKKFEAYSKQVEAARAKSKCKEKVVDDGKLFWFPRKWRGYSVDFHFSKPSEPKFSGLLRLSGVGFSYPNQEDFRLANVDVSIDMRSRIAIVGPTGAGKSTLLNLLAGVLIPTVGKVWRNEELRIRRYSQHFVDPLTMDETPVQYLLRLYSYKLERNRQVEAIGSKLVKFGLPTHNHLTPISQLSEWQKARVVFTSISMSKPHILLLDDPTHHLDMQSVSSLGDALHEFTGAVALVSHDSRLITQLCCNRGRVANRDRVAQAEIWVVDNGTVQVQTNRTARTTYEEKLIKEVNDLFY